MMRRNKLKSLIAAGLATTGCFLPSAHAIITGLATEGFTVPGTYTGGNTIRGLGNPVTNGVGGYAVYAHNGTGSPQTYFVYGNTQKSSPSILVTQAAVTFGSNALSNYVFAGIGSYGLANDGSVLYTMTSTRVNNTAPSVDALLLKNASSGTTSVIAYDGQQIGGTSSFASKYYGYNQSSSSIATLGNAKITQADDAYFFMDAVSNTFGGSQTGTAIFRATPSGTVPDILLKNGDTIAGTSGMTVGTSSGAIDSSTFGISASGNNYIDQVTTNTGSTMLVTGTPAGGVTKFLTVGSLATGGATGEVWTGFYGTAINNNGTTAVVAATSTNNNGYAIAVNGVVQYESGSTIPVAGGGSVTLGTTTSPNPSVALNSNGDYVSIYADYPAPPPGTNAKGKLIFDGIDIADTGTLIDTDGDGIPDTALTSVNPGRGVAIGDVQPNGTMSIYFFGSISSSSANTLLRDTILIGDANLDGKIDGSDYSLIDNGYLNQLTGWQNGDFNHDGVIDGSDYTLIDNEFNIQPAIASALIASPTAMPTAMLAAYSAVPEPASVGLVSITAGGLLLGRRKRSGDGFTNNIRQTASGGRH